MLPWPYLIEMLRRRYWRLVNEAQIRPGTFKWLRRSARNHLERVRPRTGHRPLRNTRAVFEMHYAEPVITVGAPLALLRLIEAMPGLFAKLCPCLFRPAALERAQRNAATKDKGQAASRVEYASKGALLSPTEYALFRVLSKVCKGHGLFIAVQVRLLDILLPPQGQGRQAAMNRIQSKHLDFVLCDARSSAIMAAIELDDSSHSQKRRHERDTFLNEAMASAGIPLHREKAAVAYDEQRLASVLHSLIKG